MKVRTFYDRFILVLCSVLFTVSVLLCSFCPVNVSAESVIGPADIASDISDFYDDAHTELDRIERAIATDINNGDLNSSTALYAEYMSVLALQAAMVSNPTITTLATLASAYGDGVSEAQQFVDYLNQNPTISVSGAGTSGVYYDNNHNIHCATIIQSSSISGTLLTSDLFTITYGFYSNQTDLFDSSLYSCSPYIYNSSAASGQIGIQCQPNNSSTRFYPYRRTFANSTYLTIQNASFYNGSVSVATIAVPIYRDTSNPPTILPSTNVCGICAGSVYEGASGYSKILGRCASETLPTASVDSDSPWDYYNNSILPYMQQNYPNVSNNYYLFPTGYIPAQPPTDPPEPTAPSGDLVLPPYGELVTEASSYYVTDESGETITDESGEPLTETTMIPVTSVTVENGNYLFRVPTLPSIFMTDTGELNISLPIKYASICGGLFSACYDVLDNSGILGVLPFLVGMAVIVYVIYKVGG